MSICFLTIPRSSQCILVHLRDLEMESIIQFFFHRSLNLNWNFFLVNILQKRIAI